MRALRWLLVGVLVLVPAACQSDDDASEASRPATPPESVRATERDGTPASPSPGAAVGATATLRHGIAEPDQLIPIDAVTPEERLIVDTLFDSLTTLNEGLRAEPAAATEWQAVDDDPSHWRFHLREDATFHDGTPVTSRDFVSAWNIAAARGRAGFLLQAVDGYADVVRGDETELVGLSAPDDLTLEVRLDAPNREFPVVAAHPALAPMQPEAWQTDETAYRNQPVGNGPFKAVEERAPGQFLRVQPFEEWVNGDDPATVDEVLFQFMDPETAYLAFQQGRLQVAEVPSAALEQALAEYGASINGYHGPGVLTGETLSLYFLGFNVTEPPFDEPEVRRAVALAIDREAMAEAVQGAAAAPAESLVSPLLRASPSAPCDPCEQQLPTARRLFRLHDVDRLEFTFSAEGGDQVIANQLRRDLREAGVNVVQFDPLPFNDYQQELQAGEAALFRFGWAPEHPTATDTLGPLFAADGPYNYFAYEHERFERFLADSRAGETPGSRSVYQYLAEQQVIDRDHVVVPLFFYQHQVVVDERLQGYVLDPMGRANLEEVRWETAS